MKICNITGNGVCVNCDGTPPRINGYSCGDICRKKVQNIINYLVDGGIYRFDGEDLYVVTIDDCKFYEEDKCEI